LFSEISASKNYPQEGTTKKASRTSDRRKTRPAWNPHETAISRHDALRPKKDGRCRPMDTLIYWSPRRRNVTPECLYPGPGSSSLFLLALHSLQSDSGFRRNDIFAFDQRVPMHPEKAELIGAWLHGDRED